jgi:hypothetical protein
MTEIPPAFWREDAGVVRAVDRQKVERSAVELCLLLDPAGLIRARAIVREAMASPPTVG